MNASSEPREPLAIGRLLPPGAPASAAEIVAGFGLHLPAKGAGVERRGPAEGAGVERREPAEGAADPPVERPRVLLNMVSTLDGRATIGGRSGPIGGPADRELFHALRTVVDAVMVGGGTARAERYGRLVREEEARALRRERGLSEEPWACIVSGRLALSAQDVPLLRDPEARVAILTSSEASLPDTEAAEIEYIRAAQEGRLDLPSAMGQLRERLGARTVLCEGGPHLNTQLLAAGLVDEIFLTLAAKLAGGDASGEALRILAGADLDPPVDLELLSVLEHESNLFLRYGVSG